MALILTCLAEAELRARLQNALSLDGAGGVAHTLEHTPVRNGVRSVILQRAPALLVFDPSDPAGRAPDEWIALLAGFPSTAAVAYLARDAGAAGLAAQLTRQGVHAVVTHPVGDSPPQLRAVLLDALATSLTERVAARLAPEIAPALRGDFRRLLAAARQPLGTQQMARLCHCSERTLHRRLLEAALPPPHHLAVWLRLVHAAHLLDDPDRTIENVALALEFASVNALRNQLVRYVGRSPGELRKAGALEGVLAAFNEERAALRCRMARSV